MPSESGATLKVLQIDSASLLLEPIKELHRRNSSVLGMFPAGAFEDAARRRTILAAVKDAAVVGYLLYREVPTRHRASIAHLCVDEHCRRSGVARILIDELKRRTIQFESITLLCRRDYDASAVWPRFGFVADTHKPGRSKAGDLLTQWRFVHRLPPMVHLWTEADDRILAIFDANVFFDVCSPPSDSNEESHALTSSWLGEFIHFQVSQELLNEIERNSDATRVKRFWGEAHRIGVLTTQMSEVTQYVEELKRLLPNKSNKVSYESDLRQIAHSIAGKARFFVTRDSLLLKQQECILDEFGLECIRPCDLILHLDEKLNVARYQPGRLAGVLMNQRLVQSGEVLGLSERFRSNNERKADFEGRLRRLLATPETNKSTVIEEDQTPIALHICANEYAASRLNIQVIRHAKALLPPGLLRYLLFQNILAALKSKCSHVLVSDANLTPETVVALEETRFCKTEAGWIKYIVPSIATQSSLPGFLAELCANAQRVGYLVRLLEQSAFDPSMVRECVELERFCWPLKVVDLMMPIWIVPIRPKWAAHLFEERIAGGHLFGAEKNLILRNENVYYRKKGTQRIQAPARVLWYVSKEAREPLSGNILACSLITDVVTGFPIQLFRQFCRLGVYRWAHVRDTADGDLEREIMAFKFVETELLRPIALDRVCGIVQLVSGKKMNLTGPYRIAPDCFEAIYREGRET